MVCPRQRAANRGQRRAARCRPWAPLPLPLRGRRRSTKPLYINGPHARAGATRASARPPSRSDSGRRQCNSRNRRCSMTRVREAELTAAALIDAFVGQSNRVAPQQLAHFDKDRGEDGELRVGDEFTIHIPGPWDGPVGVIEVDSTGFDVVTLDGHLEARRVPVGASTDFEPALVERSALRQRHPPAVVCRRRCCAGAAVPLAKPPPGPRRPSVFPRTVRLLRDGAGHPFGGRIRGLRRRIGGRPASVSVEVPTRDLRRPGASPFG